MTTVAPQYFYPDRTPAIDTIVVVDIKSINEEVVYGSLPAYGDLEVMLPTSEMNVRRNKRVTDYIRVGQLVPLRVLRIDMNKRGGVQVDVSMKQIREQEVTAAMNQYMRDTKVNLLVRTACSLDAALTEAMYRDIIWPLSEEWEGDVIAAFQLARATMDDSGAPSLGTKPHLPPELMTVIMARLPAAEYKAESEFILRFGIYPDGAHRLSAELQRLAGIPGVEIFLVAPPKYRIVVTDTSPARASQRMTDILATLPTAV
jgi:translation initiation factor 2 alpha subunit (eIF-2alpha)